MRKLFKSPKRIIAIMLLTILLFTSNVSFAAWWATPGYEWALTKNLTSVKSRNQLNQVVTHSDFYSIILKYLQLKGVRPEGKLAHHTDDMEYLNNVVAGMFKLINTYTSRNSLTPDEYRQVESYVEHARGTFEQYSQYLSRNSVKNIDLYLVLSQYKAATLINDREYKELALSRLGRVRNADIFAYGIIPYAGEITRKEFLLLMFDLLSQSNMSDDAIIKDFEDTEVLVGYETGLYLENPITYSEMLTFLYRFEYYDFDIEIENVEETEEEETTEI